MTVHKMTVYKMTVDKMTVDKMTVDTITCCRHHRPDEFQPVIGQCFKFFYT